jgi:hypothetical protein
LVGKLEDTGLGGSNRHKWKGNIKMYLRELHYEFMNFIPDTNHWLAFMKTKINFGIKKKLGVFKKNMFSC